MKAKELRVGNYIQAGGTIVRVDTIEYNEQGGYVIKMWPAFPEKRIDVTVQLDDRFPNYAQPIPLTEELLLKSGFTKSMRLFFPEQDGEFLQDYSSWCISEQDGKFYFSVNEGEFIFGEVAYLHQLQNLYFALTGEEIKVTL